MTSSRLACPGTLASCVMVVGQCSASRVINEAGSAPSSGGNLSMERCLIYARKQVHVEEGCHPTDVLVDSVQV